MTFLSDAMIALRPAHNFRVINNTELVWQDERPQPTQEEIDAKILELQAQYDANQYQRDRQPEYPSIQDQLDMQYWDRINGTNNWQQAIEAVKTKHPKPEA